MVVRVWNKSWVGWRPSSTSCSSQVNRSDSTMACTSSSAISSKLATSIVLVLGALHIDLRGFIYKWLGCLCICSTWNGFRVWWKRDGWYRRLNKFGVHGIECSLGVRRVYETLCNMALLDVHAYYRTLQYPCEIWGYQIAIHCHPASCLPRPNSASFPLP